MMLRGGHMEVDMNSIVELAKLTAITTCVVVGSTALVGSRRPESAGAHR